MQAVPKLLDSIWEVCGAPTGGEYYESGSFCLPLLSISRPVVTYLASIVDPSRYGFDVSLDTRALALIKSFTKTQAYAQLAFLVPKVLWMLQFDRYCINLPPLELLQKALFMVALAMDWMTSHRETLTRHHNWKMFAAGFLKVSLAPAPTHLVKNESEGHRL